MIFSQTSIHLAEPIYLTIGKEDLASSIGIKTKDDFVSLVNFHMPKKYAEKLKRAVDAFNKELEAAE